MFEAARDSLEYTLAVAGLVSHIHDSHGFIVSPTLGAWRGRSPTPVIVRYIEHLPDLFFESANGTVFIGSPTAGANGDVTNFYVPGGILIYFSGQGVRHLDGRQLQRVGLQPTILVTPTIAGVRAGRDEVLERALKYLGAPLH